MAGTTKFPGALDDGSTLYQPGGGDLVASVDHATLHDNSSVAIIAAETKVGTGSSTSTSGTVLRGTGTGTSQWAQANLTTDVTGTLPVANGGTGATGATGTGNVVLANTPSLTNPAFSSITNTGTLTLPSSTDTLVGRATTDTLTNKSMDGGSNTFTNIPVSGIATTSGAWSSYTPILANLTIGNGTILARYTQIGKTIHAQGTITFGTTTVMGTQPTMTLPINSSTNYNSKSVLGTGDGLRTGTSDFSLDIDWGSVSTAIFFCWNAAGTYLILTNVTATVPATWGTGDIITWNITYEAA